MKLIKQAPKKALKAFLKQKPLRSEIDVFKTNLIILLDKISVINKRPKDESEEHLKNDLRDFLRDTYYKDTNAINTKDKKDLVIHLSKTTGSEVGVIIEAKRPTNINEMVSAKNPNKKALHELILYYLDERNQAGNNQLKQLVMTNVNEWYIIDANYFDKYIYRNTQIKKLYETKINDKKDNPFFYEEIAKIVSKIEVEIPCVYFDIREYDTILRNNKKEDDRELSALLKILSPKHLLKIVTPNDSNSLNEKFYKELLHIIGLEEAKENGKNIIRRKKENRNAASLIEATIEALVTDDPFHRIPDQSIYGETKEERVFNVSLELCITWINRILFLKLLEGQLVTYHTPSISERAAGEVYRYLNTVTINDFDELFKLFHKVLAVNLTERTEAIKNKYSHVPYLNSSLFEISELEDQTIKINSLDNGGQLELINATILKDIKKKTDKLPALNYLFQFLDAYDFASEGTEDVQEDNKTLINASVLGKVFEKINGYKDGSIFTPAFITMYMCRQSIRLAVVEKFNENLTPALSKAKGEKMFDKFGDVKNYTSRLFKTQEILKANEIINSLRICDPAVGSGHFLVSSLNEIISIKAELGILADKEGNSISGYEIELVNDELIITDPKGNSLEYKLQAGKPINKEIQRLQKTLFYEKQTLIENCLFGVDINPNSVKICRLRLWIELLKNAYYKEETNYLELETLPNIDINIKCGNSLLSRFALDADLSKALKSIKYDIKAYKGFVYDYKNEKSRDVKKGLQKIIDSIKSDFRTEINNNDPKKTRLSKLAYELYNRFTGNMLFEPDEPYSKKNKDVEKKRKAEQCKIEDEITKLKTEIDKIENNKIYRNAFEWRFEFPEVLNNDGEFEGFDVVIGNPPYIRQEEVKELSSNFEVNYKTFSGKSDIYVFFYEKGLNILRNNGILNYITSGKFFEASYGKPLIDFLINESEIKSIVNFNDLPVFDGVTAYPLIFLATKNRKEEYSFPYYDLEELPKFTLQEKLESISPLNATKSIFIQNDYKFVDNAIAAIISKSKQNSISLQEFCGLPIVGVKTGFNEGFITELNSGKYVKPYVFGRDIKKYQPVNSNNKIIFPYADDFTVAPIEKENSIFASLSSQKQKLSERAIIKDGLKNGSKYWFEYQQINKTLNYDEEYIVYPNVSFGNNFTLSKGAIIDMTAFLIKSNSRYLLAILNSKLVAFLMNIWSISRRGGYLEYKVQYVEKIPIKNISIKDQKPFIDLVDKILEAKQQGKDSTNNEKKIDDLVYKLYDLTTGEQKIIEG